MSFTHYDLGYKSGGEIIEVSLSGNSANVRLLDSSNFQNFRSNRTYRGHGGRVTSSPVRLQISHAGYWYVVVDLIGLGGSVRSSVRVLPGPLPELRPVSQVPVAAPSPSASAAVPTRSTSVSLSVSVPTPPMYRPLSSLPSLVQSEEKSPEDNDDGIVREFDVFICHASEDKDAIVRPLAHALQGKNLRVWYDEFELRIGDSLRRSIDKGLANSRSGLVVLSPAFFTKGWANYELDGLVTKAITGEQVLLPIWHNLSKQEVMKYSPSLADKVARSTSTHTVDEIAAEIAEVILRKV